MNWDGLGAIAELLGAIATIAALGYLAVQIRQASAAARAQIRMSIADSQIHYVNLRATDPFLRSVSHKALLGGELTEEEHYGLRLHLVTHLRLFENHFAQQKLGTMDAEDWRAQRQLIKSSLLQQGYRDAFCIREGIWNAEFAAEIRSILEEHRIAAAQQGAAADTS